MTRLLLAGLLAAACAAGAHAQTAAENAWTERRFDPPVGSRWILEAKTHAEESRPDRNQTQTVTTRAEFAIEEKLPDGFRVSYVLHDLTAEGTAPQVKIAGPALQAMKGIVIRATTDARGMPVRVDNLAEVQATMKQVVARMSDAFAKNPRLQAVMDQMLNTLLIGDEKTAARTYLDEIPHLTVAHNTGLKPGETRRSSQLMPNPLGDGALKSELTLKLERVHPPSGMARYIQTSAVDPESARQVIGAIVGKLAGAMDKPMTSEIERVLKSMHLSIDSKAEYDVQDGMTRSILAQTDTRVSAMGHTLTKREVKRVSVFPAP